MPCLHCKVRKKDCLYRFDLGTNGGRYAMSLPAVIDTDAFEHITAVADLYVKGVTSPYTIARRLGIKAVEARAAIEQWHEIINSDAESRDMARDHLNAMVHRYDTLIAEANDNLDNLKSMTFDEKVSAQILSTMKLIGDLDKVRVDLLQKAGLLDNTDLGDELAEREEREAMILDILKNDLCSDCRHTVRDKISKLSGQVHGVEVVDAEVVPDE